MQSSKKQIDRLFSITYEELRRLAATVKKDSNIVTYNPTSLVNEAYLKISKSGSLEYNSRKHFKRIAARAMRQVLVDIARNRNSVKRGANIQFVTFNDQIDKSSHSIEGFLAMHEALNKLASYHERQAKIVELKYFGGYSVEEIAEMLGVSESTVWRDWRTAKAWLKSILKKNNSNPSTDYGR